MKPTTTRSIGDAPKTGECEFLVDHETGELVLGATVGCDTAAALRKAAEILDGAYLVARDLREDDEVAGHAVGLLAFVIEAAAALVYAAERGLTIAKEGAPT